MPFNDQADLFTTSVLAESRRGDAETRRLRGLLNGSKAIAPAPKVSPAMARLAGHFSSESERARNYLYGFHRQWYINISAYLGVNSIRTESVARTLKVNLKASVSRVQHNSNKIGGYVRRVVGFLSRSNPDIEFVAGDLNDPLQVDYARGAKGWLDWHRTYDNWRGKRLELMHWAVTCGMGVSKAIYDPTGGPRAVAVDSDGQVIIGSDGKPLVDARTGRAKSYQTGCAHTVVVPSFHYIFGISARNEEELSWNGEESWMSFRYLESLRPGIVKEFGLSPEPQFTNNSAMYERQILQTISPQQTYAVGGQETNEPGCTVRQIFIAPYYLNPEEFGDDMYEMGAFLMMSQGRIIAFEKNPFLDMEGVNPRTDWNPYTIWPCFEVPGRMIPQGLPDNILPIRESANFIISRQREAHRMMGQPRWFVQRGSINQTINNDVAQVIEYGAGFQPPIAYTPPPQPAYIMQLLERLDMDEEQVASQPPMMQGQAQGQVRSGLAVTALQEQALTMFTPIVERHAYCASRHVRQLLLREIQFGDSERRIPKRVASGAWEQELFYAKHMNPEFMVRIVPGTEMPVNKAAVMADLNFMVTSGRLNPMIPQHADVLDRALGYQIPNYSPDDTEQAMQQSRYENWIMLERPGEEPPTLATFNHRVHINEHIRFINSRRVQEKVKDEMQKLGGSPTLDALMAHVGLHKGHLLAIQQGLVLPQPVFPFDESMMGGQPAQGQVAASQQGQMVASGMGGRPQGRPGAFTGGNSQMGFARPQSPPEADIGSMDGPGTAAPSGAGGMR